ncbi:hypothetical protein M5K25_027163 [Dendrobium thyrsiflorum]|uniref:Nudix hydrolase domain-containing protein n=1 Tax=Dendrobium thyrsiflorum TaxID=117978 RepID=A0ABD0TZB6_DENTH
MQKAMLDMSSDMVFLRRTCSMLQICNLASIRFFRRMSSRQRRDISVKSSYLIAKTPTENTIASTSKNIWGKEELVINGSYGAYPWISSRESYMLEADEDEYGGVIVRPECLPQTADAFATILQSSLFHWKLQGKKGVWLRLPLDQAEFVPVAVKEGFKYHHAEQTYLMLTYWIPEGPCMLPANASHQVGVGGFVLNHRNEVLVVQEKIHYSFEDVWKLPTGFILENEEIFNGAVREVKEETGIDTEFLDVIAFRHVHHVAFEKSDLFFICMLKPLSTQIVVDELEIQAAKWMPLAEFVKQPCIQDDNMFKKIIDICIARLGKCYCGLTAHQMNSKFDSRSSTLYYNVVEPEDYNCQVS